MSKIRLKRAKNTPRVLENIQGHKKRHHLLMTPLNSLFLD